MSFLCRLTRKVSVMAIVLYSHFLGSLVGVRQSFPKLQPPTRAARMTSNF